MRGFNIVLTSSKAFPLLLAKHRRKWGRWGSGSRSKGFMTHEKSHLASGKVSVSIPSGGEQSGIHALSDRGTAQPLRCSFLVVWHSEEDDLSNGESYC